MQVRDRVGDFTYLFNNTHIMRDIPIPLGGN